jgi:hypothetical protein
MRRNFSPPPVSACRMAVAHQCTRGSFRICRPRSAKLRSLVQAKPATRVAAVALPCWTYSTSHRRQRTGIRASMSSSCTATRRSAFPSGATDSSVSGPTGSGGTRVLRWCRGRSRAISGSIRPTAGLDPRGRRLMPGSGSSGRPGRTSRVPAPVTPCGAPTTRRLSSMVAAVHPESGQPERERASPEAAGWAKSARGPIRHGVAPRTRGGRGHRSRGRRRPPLDPASASHHLARLRLRPTRCTSKRRGPRAV